jgi:hypothetical protein
MAFHLFHPRISFDPVDPLGDGLGDEIMHEQLEPEAITLEEDINASELSQFWQSVDVTDEQDPRQPNFTEQ